MYFFRAEDDDSVNRSRLPIRRRLRMRRRNAMSVFTKSTLRSTVAKTYLAREIINLNPFCTVNCLRKLDGGRLLTCNCGEESDMSRIAWHWVEDDETSAIIDEYKREIIFHPTYSHGTAALRGSEPLQRNMHHFWEIKVLTTLYGTDVMLGIGTAKCKLNAYKRRFISLLGSDDQSWGYSYNGEVHHNGQATIYGSRYNFGSLIGIHVDMFRGTIEFYLNRRPLGIAFKNLHATTTESLYPMMCSTAAQSSVRTACALTLKDTLQMRCVQCLVKYPALYAQLKTVPGLKRMCERDFFWLTPPKRIVKPKRKDLILALLALTSCTPIIELAPFDLNAFYNNFNGDDETDVSTSSSSSSDEMEFSEESESMMQEMKEKFLRLI